MKRSFTLAALGLTFLISLLGPWEATRAFPGGPESSPVEIFRDLDGTWRGTFVGYDATGKELYRIQVEQRYRTVDANVQTVQIVDTMPDGTEIKGTGKNVATVDAQGKLHLTCRVEKSNGDVVEHQGRLVQGPDGDKELVWFHQHEDREETFRETVRKEGDRSVYSIQGMGKYGDTLILMAGRYYRD